MYEGKGTFDDLVLDADRVFSALEEGTVELPVLASGIGSIKIEGDGDGAMLILDLSDAPIFTVDNHEVSTSGTLDSSDVFIRDNVLFIDLEITY